MVSVGEGEVRRFACDYHRAHWFTAEAETTGSATLCCGTEAACETPSEDERAAIEAALAQESVRPASAWPEAVLPGRDDPDGA